MYLGIDYGERRIGLALGKVMPKGFGIIQNSSDLNEVADRIKQIVLQNDVELIVIGWPIRSQGEPGTLCPKIEKLSELLTEKIGIEVVTEQEQFTSSEASRILEERGVDKSEKGKIDELAAVLILEQYIARQNPSSLSEGEGE